MFQGDRNYRAKENTKDDLCTLNQNYSPEHPKIYWCIWRSFVIVSWFIKQCFVNCIDSIVVNGKDKNGWMKNVVTSNMDWRQWNFSLNWLTSWLRFKSGTFQMKTRSINHHHPTVSFVITVMHYIIPLPSWLPTSSSMQHETVQWLKKRTYHDSSKEES
jgi:hypothetical protein